jgi:hypothetical protein
MRFVTPKMRHLLVLVAAVLGLSGCVAYPAPGYYSSGGYYDGYYPYYYGPPVVGSVVIGGGRYHHHRWR